MTPEIDWQWISYAECLSAPNEEGVVIARLYHRNDHNGNFLGNMALVRFDMGWPVQKPWLTGEGCTTAADVKGGKCPHTPGGGCAKNLECPLMRGRYK